MNDGASHDGRRKQGDKSVSGSEHAEATYSQAGTLHVIRVGIGTTITPDLNERRQALCGTWLEGPYRAAEELGVEKFKRDLCDTCEDVLRERSEDDIPREIRAAWRERQRSVYTGSDRDE